MKRGSSQAPAWSRSNRTALLEQEQELRSLPCCRAWTKPQQYRAHCLFCAVATSVGLGHRLNTVKSRSKPLKFSIVATGAWARLSGTGPVLAMAI